MRLHCGWSLFVLVALVVLPPTTTTTTTAFPSIVPATAPWNVRSTQPTTQDIHPLPPRSLVLELLVVHERPSSSANTTFTFPQDALDALPKQWTTHASFVLQEQLFFRDSKTPISVVRVVGQERQERQELEDPEIWVRVLTDAFQSTENPDSPKLLHVSLNTPVYAFQETAPFTSTTSPSTEHTSNHSQIPTESQLVYGDLWFLDVLDNPRDLVLDHAYRTQFSGNGVRVHVVDTGARLDHEELEGRAELYFVAPEWQHANGGCLPGWDCKGHGTHVAGLVAGRIHGVAKNAHVLVSQALGPPLGKGSTLSVIEVLDHIYQHPEDNRGSVVVMSLGSVRNLAVEMAVERLVLDLDMTVVVAAGNNHTDACLFSPAASPHAITVASHGRSGHRSSFSNYGTCVDVYAPGEEIRSSYAPHWNSYKTVQGTSMATPMVAGVVAMLLEQNPQLTSPEIRKLLLRNAKKIQVQEDSSQEVGVPAVYSLLKGAPCILETDQQCIYLNGHVRHTCLVDTLKAPSTHPHRHHHHTHHDCNVIRSRNWKRHQPLIPTRRQGHVHLWLYEDGSMEEGTPAHVLVHVRQTAPLSSNFDSPTSPLPSQPPQPPLPPLSPCRETFYPPQTDHYPLEIVFQLRQDCDYEVVLRSVDEHKQVPYALFLSMPRDCTTMTEPCYGRGTCSNTTGTCTCQPPYYGTLCALSTQDPTQDLPGNWWLWKVLFRSRRRMVCIGGLSMVYVGVLVAVTLLVWKRPKGCWSGLWCRRGRNQLVVEPVSLFDDDFEREEEEEEEEEEGGDTWEALEGEEKQPLITQTKRRKPSYLSTERRSAHKERNGSRWSSGSGLRSSPSSGSTSPYSELERQSHRARVSRLVHGWPGGTVGGIASNSTETLISPTPPRSSPPYQ